MRACGQTWNGWWSQLTRGDPQSPGSTKEYPDRNAQFEHVNAQAQVFLAVGEPVVSVDAKKKELAGV